MSDYSSIKPRLLRQGKLFEDPDFPASRFSISRDGTSYSNVSWKRPKDVVKNPVFIEKGATRFDVHQGRLGDCWFIAAACNLAMSSKALFERCVLPNQEFTDTGKYCGIFRFMLWRYDHWEEVIVDDRLPVDWDDSLLFAKNKTQPNEFWAPLLEKAYAKIYGCYDNINGGHINDALVDMTGGISEYVFVRKLKEENKLPADLFTKLHRTIQMNSMIGASISGAGYESSLGNGLYSDHAYSISNIAKINVRGKSVELVRLRNPWGDVEWEGSWNDKSTNWSLVDDGTKRNIGFQKHDEGEFWMSYDDFVDQFHTVYICHLTPDAVTQEVARDMHKKSWISESHHNKWILGINAGGAGNIPFQEFYWKNPQYAVTVTDADDDDRDGKCTVVVSLIQKTFDYRWENLFHMHMCFYQLQPGIKPPDSGDSIAGIKKHLRISWEPEIYLKQREVTVRVAVDPGTYVIIPATYHKDVEGEFLLRIFTEKKAKVVPSVSPDQPTIIELPLQGDESRLEALFKKHSNGDFLMDSSDLKSGVNETLNIAIGSETARNVLAMADKNRTGRLSLSEFQSSMKEIGVWQTKFKKADIDGSGDLETYKLTALFHQIGYRLSRPVMSALVKTYGGKRGKITFEDFLDATARITNIVHKVNKLTNGNYKEKIKFDLDQWLAANFEY